MLFTIVYSFLLRFFDSFGVKTPKRCSILGAAKKACQRQLFTSGNNYTVNHFSKQFSVSLPVEIKICFLFLFEVQFHQS